jgi:hypothetical protein
LFCELAFCTLASFSAYLPFFKTLGMIAVLGRGGFVFSVRCWGSSRCTANHRPAHNPNGYLLNCQAKNHRIPPMTEKKKPRGLRGV